MIEPQHALFAVTLTDGPVCIFNMTVQGRAPTLPVGGYWIGPGWYRREPTADNVNAALRKAFPAGQPQPVSWRAIDGAEIPTDASFRDAWVDTGRIGHDMVKAAAMQLDRLRVLRADKFKELDAQWMQATGQKDTSVADAIEAQRQVLRDMPVTLARDLAAATSIDELKAITLPE